MCGLKSEVTDHIEPSKGRKEIFEKNLNFLSLCSRCHNTVTAKFDAKFVPGDSIEPKILWLNEQRAGNEIMANRSFLRPKAMRYEK